MAISEKHHLPAQGNGVRIGRGCRLLALALLVTLVADGCRESLPPATAPTLTAHLAADLQNGDTLQVGDLIAIELTGQWPDSLATVTIGWSAHPDTLILAAVDSVSVAAAEGWSARRYRLSVLPTREGRVTIPPTYLVSNDEQLLAATEPITVIITSHFDPEAEPELRPLAEMVSLRNIPWLLLAITACVLAALITALIIWRRHRHQAAQPLPPPIPPGREFDESISDLRNRRLPETGQMRDFTQQLSWILRRYLGRRWDQPALEATRPEILRWLPATDLSVSEQQLVTQWLEATDTIKFAGRVPLLVETEELTDQAKQMVARCEAIAAQQQRQREEALLAAGDDPAAADSAPGESSANQQSKTGEVSF